MKFDDKPTHPATRSYVIRLHRDASPQQGAVFGRLENIWTGKRYSFETFGELSACFEKDIAAEAASAGDANEPGGPAAGTSSEPS